MNDIVIILLCMGSDKFYQKITLVLIDQLNEKIYENKIPIIVLTDEFNIYCDGYKNSKWVLLDNYINQKQNTIYFANGCVKKKNWQCCSNKIKAFDIAIKYGFTNIVYFDSDILLDDNFNYYFNFLIKMIKEYNDSVFMCPEFSLEVSHDYLSSKNNIWCNGGFFATNVKNKPDETKFIELLNNGYTDQDAFSEIWQDKLYLVQSYGFTHLYSDVIKDSLLNKIRYADDDINYYLMKKYLQLYYKHDNSSNKKNNRIAIITPIYNDYDNYNRLLFNLSLQTNLDFKIILVEDHTSGLYNDLINKYKSLNITILENQYSTNGPSLTRQIGLDYVIEKDIADWVLFLDSDDLLTSNFVLSQVNKVLEDIDIDLYTSDTLERSLNNEFNCMNIPLKGSFYKVELIKKYNIKFYNVHHYEGILFDKMYNYYIKDDYKIYKAKLPTINYMYNDKSLSNCGSFEISNKLIREPLWSSLVLLKLRELESNEHSIKQIFNKVFDKYNSLIINHIIKDEDKLKIINLYEWFIGYLNTIEPSVCNFKLKNEYEYSEAKINEIYQSLKSITHDNYNGKITLELKPFLKEKQYEIE